MTHYSAKGYDDMTIGFGKCIGWMIEEWEDRNDDYKYVDEQCV